MEIKLLQWACQLTWKSWTALPFSEGKPVSDPNCSFKTRLITGKKPSNLLCGEPELVGKETPTSRVISQKDSAFFF